MSITATHPTAGTAGIAGLLLTLPFAVLQFATHRPQSGLSALPLSVLVAMWTFVPCFLGGRGCWAGQLPERQGAFVLGNRTWDEWVRQYSTSHQNPVNRACHLVGIPMIAISVLLAPMLLWQPSWWALPASLFGFGWILQFVGHAVERKPPEFFKDWRFVFVGLRWWVAKLTGKA